MYLACVAALGKISVFREYYPSDEAAWIFNTKGSHPALHQLSTRRKLPTNADEKYYAFIRTAADSSERILVVLNFQNRQEIVKVDCSGVSAQGFVDLKSKEQLQHQSELAVELPAYGYRLFKILPS